MYKLRVQAPVHCGLNAMQDLRVNPGSVILRHPAQLDHLELPQRTQPAQLSLNMSGETYFENIAGVHINPQICMQQIYSHSLDQLQTRGAVETKVEDEIITAATQVEGIQLD